MDAINAGESSRVSLLADLTWSAQDRVVSAFARLFRGVREGIGSLLFWLQRKLWWPLSDRTTTIGAPARTLSFAAVIVVAAAAGVGALLWAAPGDNPAPETTAVVTETAQPLAAVTKAAPKVAPGPTLHGATPVFRSAPAGTASASQVGGGRPVETASSQPSASPTSQQEGSASSDSGGEATASSSSTKSPAKAAAPGPAVGPAGIAVAREFAGAFVRYETGHTDSGVRRAFGQAATPELSRALLRRPPSLPANVTVPKAKVVNVVAAPSHGSVYPVSVSLLRVGVTSELRLEMEQPKGEEWRVTNVLG